MINKNIETRQLNESSIKTQSGKRSFKEVVKTINKIRNKYHELEKKGQAFQYPQPNVRLF